MRFSIRVNNDLTLPEYAALAQTAEAAGFDQFWVSNDLFLRSAPVHPRGDWRCNVTIEVGSSILNAYTVNPAELGHACRDHGRAYWQPLQPRSLVRRGTF